jgi:hypothetical protein
VRVRHGLALQLNASVARQCRTPIWLTTAHCGQHAAVTNLVPLASDRRFGSLSAPIACTQKRRQGAWRASDAPEPRQARGSGDGQQGVLVDEIRQVHPSLGFSRPPPKLAAQPQACRAAASSCGPVPGHHGREPSSVDKGRVHHCAPLERDGLEHDRTAGQGSIPLTTAVAGSQLYEHRFRLAGRTTHSSGSGHRLVCSAALCSCTGIRQPAQGG